MGIVDNFINNFKSRNEKWKEFQENDKLNNQLEERKLSHNERILRKLVEEQRQEEIKRQLKFLSWKQQRDEQRKAREFMKFNPKLWNDNSVLRQKNIFKHNNKLFMK
jgi:hypothetical protein